MLLNHCPLFVRKLCFCWTGLCCIKSAALEYMMTKERYDMYSTYGLFSGQVFFMNQGSSNSYRPAGLQNCHCSYHLLVTDHLLLKHHWSHWNTCLSAHCDFDLWLWTSLAISNIVHDHIGMTAINLLPGSPSMMAISTNTSLIALFSHHDHCHCLQSTAC